MTFLQPYLNHERKPALSAVSHTSRVQCCDLLEAPRALRRNVGSFDRVGSVEIFSPSLSELSICETLVRFLHYY